jgi:hypothetical protein
MVGTVIGNNNPVMEKKNRTPESSACVQQANPQSQKIWKEKNLTVSLKGGINI